MLPFFPFSPSEQAVVAHKYILNLKHILAADIDVDAATLMGHIKLDIEGETAVCRLLARTGYAVEHGARSIEREVEKSVRDAVTEEWMRCPEDVADQNNKGPYERYCLAVHVSGEYVQVSRAVGRGVKGKGRREVKGRPNGGVRLGTAVATVARSGAGVRPKSLAKMGRLIDIGGESMKTGWED